MRRIQLILMICAAGFCKHVAAAPGRLQAACTSAESVVLGTVETAVVSTFPAKFTIRIDGVVSGSLVANSIVSANWPGALIGAKTISDQFRALWFLRRTASLGWEIMPIGGLNAPIFASALALPPLKSRSVAQSVSATCYESVLTILKENAEYIDQSITHLTAMETLLKENSGSMGPAGPEFARTVADFAQSSSIDVKTLALASGIRRHDVQSLIRAAAQVSAIAQSKMIGHVGLALFGWRASDPESLAALGILATASGGNSLNRSAAEALMMIHTKDAVPQLVKLLASKDAVLRAAGIRGLSMFVRGTPILTPENARTMQYLGEKPNEFLDPGIVPYVTITSVPAEREAEFVNAWILWSNRNAPRLLN